MVRNGYQEVVFFPSFPIECLVWNVPNKWFGHDNYSNDVQCVLAYLWDNTRDDVTCSEWREVNGIKYLFQPSHPWTREQANDFLYAAWNYVGFR